MASVRTLSDVKNEFLGRRELVCDFEGAAGRLSRPEAVEAVRGEHGLGDTLVVPVRLQNHVGRTNVTGTFFVYEDGAAARAHVDPSVMARIEKSLAPKEAPEGEAAAGKGDDAGKKDEGKDAAGKGDDAGKKDAAGKGDDAGKKDAAGKGDGKKDEGKKDGAAAEAK